MSDALVIGIPGFHDVGLHPRSIRIKPGLKERGFYFGKGDGHRGLSGMLIITVGLGEFFPCRRHGPADKLVVPVVPLAIEYLRHIR